MVKYIEFFIILMITITSIHSMGEIRTRFHVAEFPDNSMTASHEVRESTSAIDCCRLCTSDNTCLQCHYNGGQCKLFTGYDDTDADVQNTFRMDFDNCNVARERRNVIDTYASVNGSLKLCIEPTTTEIPTTQFQCTPYDTSLFLQSPAVEGTVIQTRLDGSVDFYRNWTDYVNGFGCEDGEFWFGLERLHQITQTPVKASIYMERADNGGIEWGNYSSFSVGSAATNYTLSLSGYTGTLADRLSLHNNAEFSTPDRDNEDAVSNCADVFLSGWWHVTCFYVNLNGYYYTGIKWFDTSSHVLMKTVIINIYPN